MLYALLLVFLVLARSLVVGDKFCGVDLEDAQNSCWQPCSTDSDCCASAEHCFETESSCGSSDLSGTEHYFCGATWCEAAHQCGTPCPETTECPSGEYCFADTPCSSISPLPVPPIPAPPTSSPYQFCGTSMSDAVEKCWQPCPRGDSDCCSGLTCFDTSANSGSGGTCNKSDYSGSNHFFCGSSWCDAAYSCQTACPGGTDDECPEGSFCYADVPCSYDNQPPPNVQAPPSQFSQYCGTSQQNAAETCWQPCRNDDDCCAGQTCYSGVTSCTYPDNIGSDHYFCGSDFCDASYECRQPCPSGYDAECSSGYRCFPNTPCNANYVPRSANMLDFGLPQNAQTLFRTYSTTTSSTNNAACSPGLALSLMCLWITSVMFTSSGHRP